jgi:hypothetical protein
VFVPRCQASKLLTAKIAMCSGMVTQNKQQKKVAGVKHRLLMSCWYVVCAADGECGCRVAMFNGSAKQIPPSDCAIMSVASLLCCWAES